MSFHLADFQGLRDGQSYEPGWQVQIANDAGQNLLHHARLQQERKASRCCAGHGVSLSTWPDQVLTMSKVSDTCMWTHRAVPLCQGVSCSSQHHIVACCPGPVARLFAQAICTGQSPLKGSVAYTADIFILSAELICSDLLSTTRDSS